MRHDQARMFRQRREQLILDRRQMNFFPTEIDVATDQVDLQIAAGEDLSLARLYM